ISANALPGQGDTAGWTEFNINLTGCQGTPLSQAIAQFEAGGDVDPVTNKLKNVDNSGNSATNVQVALREISGQDIVIGQGPAQSAPFAFVGDAATLRYEAGYYASATGVTPGLVEANVPYALAYQYAHPASGLRCLIGIVAPTTGGIPPDGRRRPTTNGTPNAITLTR